MVEHEPGLRMPALQLGCRFPAHMTEHVAGTCRLDYRHVGSVDEGLKRSGHLGVARIGEDTTVDVDSIPVAAARAVIELDGLVLVSRRGTRWLRSAVVHLELGAHHPLPVGAPAHIPQRLEPFLDALRTDKGQWTLVDEDP